MRTLILILLVLISAGFNSILAQPGQRIYSPPNKCFTVELPEAPKFRRIRMTRNDIMFRRGGSGYAAYYISPSLNSYETIFTTGVLRLYVPMNNQEFDDNTYVFMSMYGGDKEDSAFKKKADVTIAGFHGREYVYEASEAVGRALFINAGKHVYFLIYHTKSEEELSSEVVVRMFSTFKPVC